MKENKIAVLIPCYNESKTIKKVVSDYKKFYQRLIYMYMIIIQVMELIKLQVKVVQLSDMKESKEKEM